jgi:predicted CXXCH cytochrome family protein
VSRGGAAWLLAGSLALVAAAVVAALPGQRFPHEAHERLFPVCEGCHAGVLSGVAEELYPDPASCLQCHDGVREPEVEWSAPRRRASNLRFFHPDHRQLVAAAGEAESCGTCHVGPGAPSRMAVEGPQPVFCLQCHAHEAPEHLAASADCASCHLPLAAATELPVERVALFPRPPSHEAPDFLLAHAPGAQQLATCAVCHARESCERCHANADRLAEVTALPRDARVALLERGREPVYPLPPSHLAAGWGWGHGDAARSEPERCSNCHTQPSCQGCHAAGPALAVIAQLPPAHPGRAPGVRLALSARSVHPPDFDRRHGSWAATGALQCAQCHTQQSCAECHAGQDSRAFHLPNFVERHAVEVFGAASNCQSCHTTETFCRDCHTSVGLASTGRRDVAFHTGQPLWVLAHGQAARTGLESCVSCHRQADCLQCHSATQGWGVSPHGPGFDASRMAARNRLTCRWCHAGDPLDRN